MHELYHVMVSRLQSDRGDRVSCVLGGGSVVEVDMIGLLKMPTDEDPTEMVLPILSVSNVPLLIGDRCRCLGSNETCLVRNCSSSLLATALSVQCCDALALETRLLKHWVPSAASHAEKERACIWL